MHRRDRAQGHLLPLGIRQEQAFVNSVRADDSVRLVDESNGTGLDQLTDREGADLTPENHTGCPGHAATFHQVYGPVDSATAAL